MFKQFWKLPTSAKLENIIKSKNYINGKFWNLSPTLELAENVSYIDLLKSQFLKRDKDNYPSIDIPSIKSDLHNIESWPSIIWFWHSSYMIKIWGKNILVDPIFWWYASPVSFIVKNYNWSNIYTVDDLPDIDLLVITHDHYDHLDYNTVSRIIPKVKNIVTPLGVWSHLSYWWYDDDIIHELDRRSDIYIDDFKITSTPTRHFSGRWLTRQKTLWSSFVLEFEAQKIYIWWDSWYDDHFKKIGDKFGNFDLAILECWQYNEHRKYIHMTPEEVVQAVIDLNAKLVLPVHRAKFTLALHAWYEPINRFTQKADESNISYITPMIWEVTNLSKNLPRSRRRK